MTKNRFSSALIEILLAQVYEKCAVAAQKNEVIINEFQQLNEELIDLLKKQENKDSAQVFEIVKNYQHWKFDRFKDFYAEKDKPLINLNLDDYRKQIQSFLSTQPKTKKKEQSKDRFYSIEGDSRTIKVIKLPKRVLFHTSTLPKKTINLFRKIFKKEVKKSGSGIM